MPLWLLLLSISFKFVKKLDKEEFFRNYIPALEKALDYEKQIDFEVIGPDRFIEDNMLRNELDVFEN